MMLVDDDARMAVKNMVVFSSCYYTKVAPREVH
jgi:hypothetical protein